MKKRYFVRLLAALPMLAVGVSVIFFVVKAFENVWWILLAIGDFWAFQRVCKDYEWYVKELASTIRDMAVDALHE